MPSQIFTGGGGFTEGDPTVLPHWAMSNGYRARIRSHRGRGKS